MLNYTGDPKGYSGIGLAFLSIIVFILKVLGSVVKTLLGVTTPKKWFVLCVLIF